MMKLEDYNRSQTMQVSLSKEFPRRNYIACDHCGQELYDINNIILLGPPSKIEIVCKNCGFKGYRFI